MSFWWFHQTFWRSGWWNSMRNTGTIPISWWKLLINNCWICLCIRMWRSEERIRSKGLLTFINIIFHKYICIKGWKILSVFVLKFDFAIYDLSSYFRNGTSPKWMKKSHKEKSHIHNRVYQYINKNFNSLKNHHPSQWKPFKLILKSIWELFLQVQSICSCYSSNKGSMVLRDFLSLTKNKNKSLHVLIERNE